MQNIKKRFGFTILEVLIAAMVLSLAGIGAVLVEKQSIQSGGYNKHKLQATGLAQEQINLVRRLYSTAMITTAPGQSITVFNNLTGSWHIPTSTMALTSGSDTITLNGVTYTRIITFQ